MDWGLGRGVDCKALYYMNLRFLNAATSAALSLNHSPFPRFASNRLCQYVSIPLGSSVSIR